MSADAAGLRPDYAARRSALRSLLVENEIDGLLVTDLVNIRYLTGFTGSNAALLVSSWDAHGAEDRTVISTDGRYRTQVAEQVPDLHADIVRACARRVVELAGEWQLGRVGYESHVVTVDEHRGFEELSTGLELVATPGLVEQLRMVKDAYEVDRLRAACAVGDAALATLLDRGALRPGRTERQVARDLEWAMFEHGGEAVAFETIVAAGANSAVPHHRPTDAVLATGDFVKLDFGAVVGGYHSDMTRTLVLGRPADWQREVYELVREAQRAGREALRPGVPVADVDGAARAVIDAAGHGALFVHGLGHGVGLRIHEAPGIAKAGTGTLLSGVAVTVEPGVYFPGRGGVRIEDTLVVREGGPELLTRTSKDLTVVE
ncbi:aminopeptidase P family protein [Nocardia cyriacigeorgica]|uniref:M24 family metallopeptidase n=1 Tax=Nocardia cyriacigeorgica TaxID=135487 RepID=UPI0002D4EF1F|nr:Xaa-Pro peptidase family protein [Nocardia cyriacigeorgica]MBF6087963.1 aminopeptidase P family protein [Nocardia cyriacigeorgica]MBF6094117.1 aminopeptidase P family protein [Nocardia cyriacigeorgica]MBF6322698.1 aminopeptidase P family protein [Nocardia cyriacigeorgica]MBF6396244.1 aminopeptidase P family protein [Nocardia cyriacigeorgica]MBF6401876.1 aminopeptidase P family protein [Nocardia cyriacigeorgica]